MSSNSYTTVCPVCEWTLDVCESNRPYPSIDTWCRTCWFTTYTTRDRESLQTINDNRIEWDEEPITEEEYHKRDKDEYFSSLNDMS